MSDHIVLREDNFLKPTPIESMPLLDAPESSMEIGVHDFAASGILPSIGHSVSDERNVEIAIPEDKELLIQSVECRICQEEDDIKHLDTPCACSGSLKYAHKACLQRWVNEKGDLSCEICHEPYKPGYIAPPPVIPDETAIDIDMSGGWTISGNPFNLHDPRVLAMAAAHHHFLEAEYDEYAATNASGAAFCRSAALILMALLLLRYALTITNGEGEDDPSTFFSLFLLRAAGFLLPCYIMAWAISILQRRRQRQLKDELEVLVRKGYLGKYVANQATPQEPPEAIDNRPRGVQINVISGGVASGGDTSCGRKRYAQKVYCEEKIALSSLEKQAISFSEEDLYGVHTPHDVALVISAVINCCDVHRILVDNGSALDVLSFDCFLKMGGNPSDLRAIRIPLCGFNGHATYLAGVINLPVTVGTHLRDITFVANFIGIKGMNAHNALFGRGILSRIRVVSPTYHQKMKFPTRGGMGARKENSVSDSVSPGSETESSRSRPNSAETV